MKVVELLVEDVSEVDREGDRYLAGVGLDTYVSADAILSIKDVGDTTPRVLASDDLDRLLVGAVIDATVDDVRVRAVRTRNTTTVATWALSEEIGGSSTATTLELDDAVLVTDAPIQPAPVVTLPLPTESGERFWGQTNDAGPQYWFVRGSSPYVSVGYVPANSGTLPVPTEHVAKRGLVYLSERAPEET